MSENASFFDLLRQHFERIPFGRHLGVEIREVRDGYARLELPFRPEFIGNTELPALHGGILLSVADQCGGLVLYTKAGPTAKLSTVDLRMDFLKPAPPKTLVVEGQVLRAGNRIGVVELRLSSEGKPDELLAFGVGVYNISLA